MADRELFFDGGRVEQRYEDGCHIVEAIYDDGREYLAAKNLQPKESE